MQLEKNGMFGNVPNVDDRFTTCIYMEITCFRWKTKINNRPALQAFYFAFKPAYTLHAMIIRLYQRRSITAPFKRLYGRFLLCGFIRRK